MFKIYKIYSIVEKNPKIQLLILSFWIILVTILETFGIGMLIPLLSIFMNSLEEIRDKLTLLSNFPIIYNYFIALDKKQLIYFCIFTILIIYFIKSLVVIYFGLYSSRFVYNIQASLSGIMFNSYLGKPYNFHLNKNSSELIRNITVEVGVFVGSVLIPLIYIFTESVISITLLSFLILLDPMIILSVCFSFAIILFLITIFSKNFLKNWGKIRQEKSAIVIKNLQEGLGAIKEIKILGLESEFSNNFQKQNYLKNRVESNIMAFQQIPKVFLELLAITTFSSIVIYFVILKKDFEYIVPILGIFAATAFRLLPSANKILLNLNAFSYGFPVVSLIFNDIKKIDKNNHFFKKSEKKLLFSSLNLNNVSFNYSSSGKLILNQVSLEVKAGQKIGFCGPSGAGKSTLIDIICGLLEVSSGEILINKIPIKEINREWQNIIGYVSQSPYLIDDTLKKNIAFGFDDDQIEDKKITEISKKIELDDLLKGLPDGINTFVGEKGARLSGGQRQRIAIARALYRDCQILVLDEATSALDNSTEKKIVNSIDRFRSQKTIFVISHRKSSLENCDKIFKLNNYGKIEQTAFKDI
jgi:ABC-type multidrug transport system fused ATPase/permease subunit